MQETWRQHGRGGGTLYDKIYPVVSQYRSIVVSAPTGHGKTYSSIDVAIDLLREGKYRYVILMQPLTSLNYEVFTHIDKVAGDLNPIIVNKHFSAYPSVVKSSRFIVTTYYKVNTVLQHIDRSERILFILDEIHNLASGTDEKDRAWVELTISRIKSEYRNAVFIALSATLNDEDVSKLATWLDAYRLKIKEERKVPIKYILYRIGITKDENDTISYNLVGDNGEIIPLITGNPKEAVARLIDHIRSRDGGGILVFAPTTASCDSLAELIAGFIDDFSDETLSSRVIKNTESDEVLSETIVSGVGIHHSKISVENRHYVQELFASRRIPVVVTAYTLSQGVNLPARHMIMSTLYEPHRKDYMDATTFHQLTGRVGRPGLDDYGFVHVIASDDSEESHFRTIVASSYRPISSSLGNKRYIERFTLYFLSTYRNINSLADLWRNTLFYVERGSDGISEIMNAVGEVIDKLSSEGIIESVDSQGNVWLKREYYVGGRMMMHPMEVDTALYIAREILPNVDFNSSESVDQAYRVIIQAIVDTAIDVFGREKYANIVGVENIVDRIIEFGGLGIYFADIENAYIYRDMADLITSQLELYAIYLHNLSIGRRSDIDYREMKRRLVKFIDMFEVPSIPVFRKLNEVLNRDEMKGIIRNFGNAIIREGCINKSLVQTIEDFLMKYRRFRSNAKRQARFKKIVNEVMCRGKDNKS